MYRKNISAKITIFNGSDQKEVTSANMVKEADFVYSYVWQSNTNDDDGVYTAQIVITSGAYTSIEEHKFNMVKETE